MTEQALKSISLVAEDDFSSTGQYRFGTINSSGKVALTGSGARGDGVIQNNPVADDAVTFAIGGVSYVEYGGSITAGAQVQSGASGVAISGSTNPMGVALETGVSGEKRPVLIHPR